MRLQQLITKCVIALMLIISASFGVSASVSISHSMPTELRAHCMMNMPDAAECCAAMMVHDLTAMSATDNDHTTHPSSDSCCSDTECHSHSLNMAILADTLAYQTFKPTQGFDDREGERLSYTEFIFRPPTTC
ncbi:hypothetical protein L4C36_14370 [Photobacterium japonica]|uniref:hypothetical protein n=1 Tax=Photobacterium japonica TaxID=2910235 RepID=UPI003D1222D8